MSVVQSGLFVLIGAMALLLGVDRLRIHGFAALAAATPVAFRVLCAAFVLIAVLGLAITPAEQALIESADAALARFGATLAYLGHAGTIAVFSWWLLNTRGAEAPPQTLDTIVPIAWAMMFELVFVGAWVWIIAGGIARGRESYWPPGFLGFSIAKAVSFWFGFAALVVNDKWMIILGVGAVTFVTGPLWHLWVARVMIGRLAGAARER
ncbi:MAG: hypothetical protein ACXWZL_04090 [Mycobacterium sp.]